MLVIKIISFLKLNMYKLVETFFNNGYISGCHRLPSFGIINNIPPPPPQFPLVSTQNIAEQHPVLAIVIT